MALPLSRNTTYAPLSQLKSQDLNDLQDATVFGLHGWLWLDVSINEDIQHVSGTAPTRLATGDLELVSGTQIEADFVLQSNVYIRTLRARMSSTDAAGQLTVQIGSRSDGSVTPLATVTDGPGAASTWFWVTLDLSGAPITRASELEVLRWAVTGVNAGTHTLTKLQAEISAQ